MRRSALIIGECEAGRRQHQARRRRPAVNWGRLAIVAAVLMLLVTASVFTWRWLRSTPRFVVTRIETSHYRYTDPSTLDGLLETYMSRNIWSLSTARIEAQVGSLPWVREVRAVRRLPGMLQIHFSEWRPLVQIASPEDEGYVLLENGKIEHFPASLPRPGLPVLVGMEPTAADSAGQRGLSPPGADRVISLLAAVGESGLETVCPVDFLLVEERGFTLVLRGDRGNLLLGWEEFGLRLRKFLVARDKLESGGEIDLRFRNRVSVD